VSTSAITPIRIVVAVIPTSFPADAAPVAAPVAPVAPVAAGELLAAPLADAAVVEVPLGWVDDELHAPVTKTATSAITRSAKERARTKRPEAEMALILARATTLPPAMVILHSEIPVPIVRKLHWPGNARVPLNGTGAVAKVDLYIYM
jgi:hypothetical protein